MFNIIVCGCILFVVFCYTSRLEWKMILNKIQSFFYSNEVMKTRLEEIFKSIHEVNIRGDLDKRVEYIDGKGYKVCTFGKHILLFGYGSGKWRYYIQYHKDLIDRYYVSGMVTDDGEVIIKNVNDYLYIRNFLDVFKVLTRKD